MVLPSGNTAMVGCSLANLDLATLVTTHLLAFRWRTEVMGTMVDRSLDMGASMVCKYIIFITCWLQYLQWVLDLSFV